MMNKAYYTNACICFITYELSCRTCYRWYIQCLLYHVHLIVTLTLAELLASDSRDSLAAVLGSCGLPVPWDSLPFPARIQGPVSHACPVHVLCCLSPSAWPSRTCPSLGNLRRRVVVVFHTVLIVSDDEHSCCHIIAIYYVKYIYHSICNNE